ncbi:MULTISPECIES: MFS transporter permease [unclassified Rummeliibacillus]|uniref:MFS transporter permease n=1 Tax=unclassified Rummeliibacillus TaxID=2622809 RepID=UPI000E672702|nr:MULTISPECIES: MFS transporter permease [unclassified Rummeliibacillus]RIJ66217.1 MFS transporter permease [Rummeliibacillus sp. POC4]RPJ95217.1 MFS transporter permease [Rummeliibacillus sp. TYF005]
MSKLSKMLIAIASVIIIGLVGKAFVLDEEVKGYLVTFFFVGSGLALLRLFINAMIGKMKGKHIVVKIGFFAALLGVGIPFQSWFRTEVIFSMSKTFIVPSVSVMVASVVLMTIVYGLIGKRVQAARAEEPQLN